MVLEWAELKIREGAEEEFAAAMAARGIPLLAAADGARSVSLGRGVEHPAKFLLLVEWDTLDSHIAFTQHPTFDEFRDLITPFSEGGGMEHFQMG